MSAQTPLLLSQSWLPAPSSRFSPRRFIRGVLCGVLAIFWLFHASGLAAKKQKAPTTKTVSGKVMDQADNGIGGAEVTLKNVQTGKTIAIYAEADGQYQFTDLDPHDDYEIQANSKGVASDVRKVSTFDTRWKVVLNLTIPPPSP